MNATEAEEPFVTESAFTERADGAARRRPSWRSLLDRVLEPGAGPASVRSDGTAVTPRPVHADDDAPPESSWLTWLTRAIVGICMLVLFWKLHGFKLPSQIASEKASAGGKAAPPLNLWRSIGDWITPWRWGRGDLLKNTTATGGDMGAHVFTPDFVRHHLLPKLRLTGWTDSYYAGMPVLNFYFPLPSLLIAFLSFVLPYNVAFKLVTVLGLIALPAAARKAGQLANLRPPVPTLMALGAVIYVFSRNYDLQIYGGNVQATMAGEFSFSISLAAAVLFLGLFTRALRTGNGRGRAAAMLAVTGLCHLLPTLFALVAAFFILLSHVDRERLRIRRPALAGVGVGVAAVLALLVAAVNTLPHAVIAFGAVLFMMVLADWLTGAIGLGQFRDVILMLGFGGSLAGFWLVPFFTNLPYSNDMKWEKMTKYVANLFPFWAGKGGKPYADAGIVAVLMLLAAIGAIGAWASVAAALRRSVERRMEWSPSVMPLAVIAASLVGLITALVGKSGWLGLAAAVAIVVVVFVVYVALVDESLVWTGILLTTAVAVAVIALLERSSSTLTVAIAGIVGMAVLTVRAAMSGETFHRWPVSLTMVLATIATLFRFSPQFRLWNARALPFWFYAVGLLAAFGATEIPRWFAAAVRHYAEPRRALSELPTIGASVAAVATFLAVGLPLNLVPGNVPVPDVKGGRIGIQLAKKSLDSNPGPGWAAYNFAGYEARAWNEYKALMDTASTVGKQHGCGRAMWEYEDAKLNSFGTTLALMLLPYWTKGCIGSMEAVYFESSATTPSHFLTAAFVTAPAVTNADGSKKYSGPSNPQRFLRYPAVTVDNYPTMFATGIKKLQNAGVKYYISMTDLSQRTADAHPDLVKVANSGAFNIYEIKNSDRVAPLTEQPVVIRGIDQDQDGGWLDVEQEWFLGEKADVYPNTIAWSGPKEWQRIDAKVEKPKNEYTYGVGVTVTKAEHRKLEPVTVTKITQDNVDIHFHVDKVGVPVLVKTSYFPNWKASGAKGPYRVMPNFMVVIPTKNDVHLHYGYSRADLLGFFASALGLAGIVLLHRRRALDRAFDIETSAGAHAFANTGAANDQRAEDLRAEDLRADDQRADDIAMDDLSPEDLAAMNLPIVEQHHEPRPTTVADAAAADEPVETNDSSDAKPAE